jgi:hypothetical protein
MAKFCALPAQLKGLCGSAKSAGSQTSRPAEREGTLDAVTMFSARTAPARNSSVYSQFCLYRSQNTAGSRLLDEGNDANRF